MRYRLRHRHRHGHGHGGALLQRHEMKSKIAGDVWVCVKENGVEERVPWPFGSDWF